MPARLNWLGRHNAGLDGMIAVESWLSTSLDPRLLGLVKLRASQINGCAFCIHMHSAELRQNGESETRMLLLDAWHESRLFSERERAALAWTESLTRISETRASEADYDSVRPHFSEDELVALSIAIAMINAWNRLAIGFRSEHPGEREQRPERIA